MSVRTKSNVENFMRGGDTFRHKVVMFLASVSWIVAMSFVASVVTFFSALFVMTSSPEREVFWYYVIAKFEKMVHLGGAKWFIRSVEIEGTPYGSLRPHEVVDLTAKVFSENLATPSFFAALLGLAAFCAVAYYISRFYFNFGREAGEDEFLHGVVLAEKEKLIEAVKESRDGAGQYTLAGVPIPKGKEMRNILAFGGMGSGKSQLIKDLMMQVAGAGKKMIIYDRSGEFTEMLFRPGKDFILQPFDSRFAGWNVFSEARYVFDFEKIAHSLIPDPEGGNPTAKFFANGARTVFYCIVEKLWRENRRDMESLTEALLYPSKLLAEFLAGTPAAAFLAGEGDQAAGITASLTEAVGSLRHMALSGDFSITEWIMRDDDSRLFIPSSEDVQSLVRPIISMMLDIAIRAAMSRPITDTDKLWVFLDEIDSLRTLSVLKDSLVQGRKYGIVHVVGLQNIAQLRVNYGKDVAQTLRSNLQTQMILRVSDEETAEACSKLIGKQELDENRESLSFGAASSKDGSGVQTGRAEKTPVFASDIQKLPDCEGYLILPGDFPVARVSYKPRGFDVVAPGFVLRDGLLLTTVAVAAVAVAEVAQPDEAEPENTSLAVDIDEEAFGDELETETDPDTEPTADDQQSETEEYVF